MTGDDQPPAPRSGGRDLSTARIAAIFDREIADATENIEPTEFVDWLQRLRAEVLGIAVDHPAWPAPGEHLWTRWFPESGPPKPTQHRSCVHPRCNAAESREAPQ